MTIGTVLDELEGYVGPIANSFKSQSANIYGDTPLGTLPFKVRNCKLVATVGGVEIRERAGVLGSRNLDSDGPVWMAGGKQDEPVGKRERDASSCVIVSTAK